MNDEQLLRFSRQIMLSGCDYEGQEAICNARVVIIGAGGLASPVALYLAAAGVGFIRLVDDDTIDLSNIQRQIAFDIESAGAAKVDVLAKQMLKRNPDMVVDIIHDRLTDRNAETLCTGVDVIVDCSDNYAARFAINDTALRLKLPVVFGAATAWQGQVFVMQPRQPNSPCYACFNPHRDELDASCSRNGVIGPLVGVIGATQALEVLRLLLQPALASVLQIYDAAEGYWHRVGLSPKHDCQCRNVLAVG